METTTTNQTQPQQQETTQPVYLQPLTMMQEFLNEAKQAPGTIAFSIPSGLTVSRRLNPVLQVGVTFRPPLGQLVDNLSVAAPMSCASSRSSPAPFEMTNVYPPIAFIKNGMYTVSAHATDAEGKAYVATLMFYVVD